MGNCTIAFLYQFFGKLLRTRSHCFIFFLFLRHGVGKRNIPQIPCRCDRQTKLKMHKRPLNKYLTLFVLCKAVLLYFLRHAW